MKLLIVRHGDPDYTIDSLTEKGWREAEFLSERLTKLEIRDFYVSPLGRAKDTASPTLKKMNRTATECDWLREFDVLIDRPDVTDKKIITLFNKCDRVTGDEVLQDFRADKTLRISAKTGQGLDTLKEVFEDLLRDGKVLLKHTFPYEKAGEIQKIRKYGELLKEEYTPDGIYVEAYVPPEL